MEGRFTTQQMEAKNNMIDCFDFKPLELSGKVWNDIKEDGKKDKYVKVTYDSEGNRHEEEVDEPFINLVENKKVDVQLCRREDCIASLRSKEVPDSVNEEKGTVEYEDGTIGYKNKGTVEYKDGTVKFDKDGNYTLKTNQFKDLTVKVVFNSEDKGKRLICTKYDETTQNVFKNGVAQRIIPPGSTISDETHGIMDGKVAGLDCGIAELPPLPETGGIGEMIFYVAGMVVMGLGVLSTKFLMKY